MRSLAYAAILLLASAPLAAQQSPSDTANITVERIGLQPGQSASFTLAPGIEHQLLQRAAANAAGAITIRYEAAGGQSTVTATSRTGYATVFTILADPDGDGGFAPAGEIELPGDGSATSRSWPGALGPINVGDFVGGPHGTHPHVPSGE
jgi:hypothetical protein